MIAPGDPFGRLTALERVDAQGKRWRCICACGREVVVERKNLHRGHTTSCGCKRASNGCLGDRPLGALSYTTKRAAEAIHDELMDGRSTVTELAIVLGEPRRRVQHAVERLRAVGLVVPVTDPEPWHSPREVVYDVARTRASAPRTN